MCDALDPNSNIKYAALFLLSKYKKFASWSKAIKHYHSSRCKKGDRYYKCVMQARELINKRDTHIFKFITNELIFIVILFTNFST